MQHSRINRTQPRRGPALWSAAAALACAVALCQPNVAYAAPHGGGGGGGFHGGGGFGGFHGGGVGGLHGGGFHAGLLWLLYVHRERAMAADSRR